MKIYTIPVADEFKPVRQNSTYPAHNQDYGVEQDFEAYLTKSPQLITDNAKDADWHYLPIYWTRWLVNHDYGKRELHVLQHYVDKVIINSKKTFTICQYDDGPVVNLKYTKIFLSSRKSKLGIDIPLLSSAHREPWLNLPKKYLGSFVGRLSTHEIRQRMRDALINNPSYYIKDGNVGTRKYISVLKRSYVALSPRGYGGSSFRYYEAMQLGTVPMLIGDLDTRPFKQFIDWDSCSIYTSKPKDIEKILNTYSQSRLVEMGKNAKHIWEFQLNYQKWCNLVLKTLE